MAAVLRVKRRCDEEPHEALVLACKRRKTGGEVISGDEHPITTILQFAATVKTQHEDVAPHISSLKRDDLKTVLKHTADVAKRLRKQTKEASESNRYKVVNYFRQLQETDQIHSEQDVIQAEKEGNKILTVVDIVSTSKEDVENDMDYKAAEEEEKMDGAGEAPKKGDAYVYDLYYGEADDFVALDHLVDIQPLSQTLDFSSPRALGEGDSAEEEDEDDSNDENNWRNDYPDSDHSLNEDDMRLAMQMGNVRLGSDNELSSDEEEEKYLYERDMDPLDIQRYGERYAHYKARTIRELSEGEGESSDEEGVYGKNGEDSSPECDHGNDDDDDEDPALRFM